MDLPCITTKLPFANLHLTFVRFFSSFSSVEVILVPPILLGNRGDMMNVLSAPRDILAMTRLLRLSECRLVLAAVLRSLTKGSDAPDVDRSVVVSVQHNVIKLDT